MGIVDSQREIVLRICGMVFVRWLLADAQPPADRNVCNNCCSFLCEKKGFSGKSSFALGRIFLLFMDCKCLKQSLFDIIRSMFL